VLDSSSLTHNVITGYDPANYGVGDLALSRSSKYLWATTRAKANSTYYSYISGFLLDGDGFITKKMFTVPTTRTGGTNNAITPAPWDDEVVALADSPRGFVQLWRMKGGKDNGNGMEYNNAEPMATLDIADGGCCTNVLWYN